MLKSPTAPAGLIFGLIMHKLVKHIKQAPWWAKLLPLLVCQLAAVALLHDKVEQSDSKRYLAFAENLTHGRYADPETLNLWNGPGYPIILSVFLWFNAPLIAAKFLNALLLFGAIVFLVAAARCHVPKNTALLAGYLLGAYCPIYVFLPALMTESLAVFLVCMAVYFTFRFYQSQLIRHGLAAGVCVGCLALTKVFFGYVLMAGLSFSCLAMFFHRSHWKAAVIASTGLVICLPYLVYTYSITGSVFYWSNAGGTTIYWMSTPFEDEYGSWHGYQHVQEIEALARHRPFYTEVEKLNYVEQDKAFKRKAWDNIKQHPGKYAFNVAMNISRLWFNFPRSHGREHPLKLGYFVPNMFLFAFSVASLYPAFICRTKIAEEWYVVLGFVLVFLGGQALVSASARLLIPVVPAIIVWLVYVKAKFVAIRDVGLRDVDAFQSLND